MRTLFLTYLVQGVLLGAAGLALAALARVLRRRYGPAWLCRAWLALAILLVLPLRLALPAAAPAPVRLTPPAVLLEASPAQAQPVFPPQNPALPQTGGETAIPGGQSIAGQSGPSPVLPAPLDALALVWLAGAAGSLAWQWLSYGVWLRHTLRRSLPAPDRWQTALNAALARQPVGRHVRVLAGPVDGPLVTGFSRPVLLVPEGEQPGADASCVLAHELAHLRRHDLARKGLFTLVRALHWYNPLVRLTLRRAAREMEYACDAAALRALGTDCRAAYGGALLRAAGRGRVPALTGGFAFSKREMKTRLARLWDAAPKRRGAAALALVCLAGCALGVLVACGEPAASQPDSTPPPTARPEPTPEPTPDLAGDQAVWPSVYYGHNGGNHFDEITDTLPLNEAEQIARWTGYASPGRQYAGIAQYLYGENTETVTGSSVLTLWNTADRGEHWTATPLDLSDWLAEQAEVSGWTELGEGRSTVSPVHYQFVNPEVGFLACWGQYEYRNENGRAYADSKEFLLLRTLDGGASWERMYSGDGTNLAEGAAMTLNLCTPFAFLNENVGFLCAHAPEYGYDDGHFNVLRTTDGGRNWQRLDMRELEASLPGGVWDKPHACGAIGRGVSDMPEDIPDPDTPGSIALSTWNMGTDRPYIVLYSQDWGETWDWIYRNQKDRENYGQ